ncbi:MAG: LPS assembly lipoprotein LptE [Arcobacter sp.]|uniref:LPS assembly lipoprotein LptE n=1 Tax=Arcobacter sp. TaxID=1872629 RepID=UPI003CFD02DA
MHISKTLLFFVFTISIAFFINACGYKPSTYYAKKEMEGNVFVKLDVSLEDPRNSVLVKDAVNKILLQKLDSKIVNDRNRADVIMNLGINSVRISTLQYDKEGYNKLYKAIVIIKVEYFRKDDGIKKSFTVDGEYDFSIDIGTTLTDSNRFDAISNASTKAVDEILSKIAVASFK